MLHPITGKLEAEMLLATIDSFVARSLPPAPSRSGLEYYREQIEHDLALARQGRAYIEWCLAQLQQQR